MTWWWGIVFSGIQCDDALPFIFLLLQWYPGEVLLLLPYSGDSACSGGEYDMITILHWWKCSLHSYCCDTIVLWVFSIDGSITIQADDIDAAIGGLMLILHLIWWMPTDMLLLYTVHPCRYDEGWCSDGCHYCSYSLWCHLFWPSASSDMEWFCYSCSVLENYCCIPCTCHWWWCGDGRPAPVRCGRPCGWRPCCSVRCSRRSSDDDDGRWCTFRRLPCSTMLLLPSSDLALLGILRYSIWWFCSVTLLPCMGWYSTCVVPFYLPWKGSILFTLFSLETMEGYCYVPLYFFLLPFSVLCR